MNVTLPLEANTDLRTFIDVTSWRAPYDAWDFANRIVPAARLANGHEGYWDCAARDIYAAAALHLAQTPTPAARTITALAALTQSSGILRNGLLLIYRAHLRAALQALDDRTDGCIHHFIVEMLSHHFLRPEMEQGAVLSSTVCYRDVLLAGAA